jgi:pimeloyl-ACP methyl ester carboxylesterase
MKRQILIFWCAIVSAFPSSQLPILAQSQPSNVPSAIFGDPPRDAANPTRNEAVWIPSGGVLMNGVMYAAAGSGNHPTVLSLHGTPGNEQNLDIAQTLRRAGYNVLSFHYRGSWGSPGRFTQAGGVDDGISALAFLQDPAVVAKFHIDTQRLIVIGHSYGGFAAARVAAAHPNIAAIVLLAPWNPAQDISMFNVPPAKFAAAAHSIFDDDEGRMGGYTDIDMAKEILAPGYDWRLETSAERIKNVPILLLSAKYDTPDCQGTELVAALGRLHPADVTTISMDTDHPFSDHRIALEKEILNWLQPRTSPSATGANSR